MRSRAEPATILAVRFPLSEREAIRQAAAQAGESFGGYVRRAAMERLRATTTQAPSDTPSECLAA
jgi:hypothetical protein